MGLHNAQQWKKIIKENPEIFGNSFITQLPNNEIPEIVMEDMTSFIRKTAHNKNTWQGVIEKIKERIQMSHKTEKYIIVIDEKSFVPVTKKIEQDKRDSTNKKETDKFTKEELEYVITHGINPIPEKFKNADFIKKVINSRELYNDMHSYLAAELTDFSFPFDENKGKTHLIIDGPSINSFSSRMKNEMSKRVITINSPDDLHKYKFRKLEDLPLYQSGKEINYKTESVIKKNKPIETCIFDIFRPKEAQKNNVAVFKSNEIGEGELKFGRHLIDLNPKIEKTIFIISDDTDLIPILLLSMRQFISKKEGGDDDREDINFKIYVDITYSKKKSEARKKGIEFIPDILDMTTMWYSILEYFNTHRRTVKCPIETIAFLMALCGTDYTESLYWFTPERVWKFFMEEGYKYFSKDESIKVEEYGSITGPRSNKDVYAISYAGPYGNPKERIEILIAEHKIYIFIKNYYYRTFVFKNNTKPILEDSLEPLRKTKGKIIEDNKIFAHIRRSMFVVEYWTDAYLYIPDPVMNPIEISAGGRSKYGWELEKDKVIRSERVQRFNTQHIIQE